MTQLRIALLTIVCLLVAVFPVKAGLVVDILGQAHHQSYTTVPGQWFQVGQISGNPNNNANNYPFATFSNYSATPPLPALVSPGDLANFGLALDGVIDSLELVAGRWVTSYSGEFWIVAPGYGLVDTATQAVEHGTFVGTIWSNDQGLLDLQALFYNDPGYASSGLTLDFSPASPMRLTAVSQWVQIGGEWVQTIDGTFVGPVPEPSTLMLSLGGGVAVVLVGRRFRRKGLAVHCASS